MRAPALGLAAGLALAAVPRPAPACDYFPQFVAGAPVEGALVPTNAQAFARAPFMARTPMHAELYDPRAFAPIPVEVRALGDDIVQLELPPLDPSIEYTARVWMDTVDDAAFDFAFVPGRSPDVDAPPAPTVAWGGHEGPANSCESSGFYLDLEVGRVADPDVLLYEVVEVLPNDELIAVGAALLTDEATPTQHLSAHVGPRPLNDRCFSVRSVDQAGNRSSPDELHCFSAIPIDGGVPSRPDSGVVDSGVVEVDAGSPSDAGQPAADGGAPALGGGALSAGDGGCGCSGHPSSRGPAGGALGLVLGVGLLARRRGRTASREAAT